MRYRKSTDVNTSGNFYWKWWKYNPTVLMGDDTYTYNGKNVELRDMSDVVTKQFHKQRAAGVIINTPMYRQHVKRTRSVATLSRTGYVKTDMRPMLQTGELPTPELVAQPILSHGIPFDEYLVQYNADRDYAVMKAWSRVEESEVQALASLGELPETLRWATSVFRRFLELVRLLKSKNLLKKAKALTRINRRTVDGSSDLWLEWRYAIRPLIFEAEAIAEALAKSLKKRNTARGFNGIKSPGTPTTTRIVSGIYSWDETRTVKQEHNYRAGVLYDLDPGFVSLSAVWGIDQPLESAYELIPFSFILDWFFNFGMWLSAWTDNAGISPKSSWVYESHLREEVVTWNNIAVVTDDGQIVSSVTSQTPGTSSSIALYERRIPSPARPSLPPFKLRLDTSKLLDLVTIGRNLLSKN
jgi:hypothetical protein